MQNVDSLIQARWLVTVDPQDNVFENYSVVIDNGKITDILPTAKALISYKANNNYQRHSHVLMPGLINSHTHTPMSLFRGLADDLPLHEWLTRHIWPAEQKWVSPEFVKDGAELAIAEMLKSGTTCFNDMYFYSDVIARSSVKTGIRAVIGLIVLEFPTIWAQTPDEYISKGVAIHDEYKSSARISTAWAPHAPYTVSDKSLAKIRTLADELEIPLHIHLHETRQEIEDAFKDTGGRPFARLDSLGLLGPGLIAVHMTQLTTDEMQIGAANNINVVHCPASNMKLASGFCPVVELLDAGVNVSLGTDGCASNNNLDLFGEMKLAALLAKVHMLDAKVLAAPQVLRMATINGAKALGLESKIGSIELGKEADLITLDMTEAGAMPVYNPVSHLVYSTSHSQVTDVWVAGKILLKQHELMTIDLAEIAEKAYVWSNKISI